LPGCDALGYIACTGTNFCLRACALATVGWFPTYCITGGLGRYRSWWFELCRCRWGHRLFSRLL